MDKVFNYIFLDIDGVLNHQFSKDKNYSQLERFGLAQDLVDNLKFVIDSVDNCKIVISSSWRHFRTNEILSKDKNWRDILCDMLHVSYDTVIGDIPTTYEFSERNAKARVKDIKSWFNINENSKISAFVIIDDECTELKKAFPNNVVDCEIMTSNGFTKNKAKEAIWILSNFGKNKKMTNNTYFISDTHFYHDNIIQYCNRPFSSVEEMNEKIIENWNSIVEKNDTVWHCGDFCFGKNQDNTIVELMSKLNGNINLIVGNHDRRPIKFYYDVGFKKVYDKPVILNNFIVLSHEPMQWVQEPIFNIFGHVHDNPLFKTISKNGCCVCVERWNYKPISWKTIETMYEKCKS